MLQRSFLKWWPNEREKLMSRSDRIHKFGGSDVLKIEDAVVPRPGKVRLRVVGLNQSEISVPVRSCRLGAALAFADGFGGALI